MGLSHSRVRYVKKGRGEGNPDVPTKAAAKGGDG